jgi:hypothetical protein
MSVFHCKVRCRVPTAAPHVSESVSVGPKIVRSMQHTYGMSALSRATIDLSFVFEKELLKLFN